MESGGNEIMAPTKSSNPDFQADTPLRAGASLLDGLMNRDARVWLSSSYVLVLAVMCFFVWDTRRENRELKTYVQNDSKAILAALINNTTALDQNTRTLRALANKVDTTE